MSGSPWTLAISSWFNNFVCSSSGQYLVGIYANNVYTSSDYGSTWSSGTSVASQSLGDIACDSTGQYVVITTRLRGGAPGQIYRSTDYGTTFVVLSSSPSGMWSIITCNSTGQYLVAGEADNAYQKLYYSTNYGETWNQCIVSEDKFWYGLTCSSNGQYVVASGNSSESSSIYTSSDYGANFIAIGAIAVGKYVQELACDSTGQYVVAAMGNGGIYRSTNYGATWTQTNADITNNQSYSSISSDSTGQYLIAGDSSGYRTYLSSDSAATWALQNTPGNENGDGTTTARISSNHLYLFSSIDSVGTFVYQNQSSPPNPSPTSINIACFKENTKILCKIDDVEQYVLIQNLKRGDLVRTLKNGYKPIYMVGYREIYNPVVNDRIGDQLYVCSQDKYPEISEDLIITGYHSILVDNLTEMERNKTIDMFKKIYVTDKKYRLAACIDERTTIYDKQGDYTVFHLALDNDDHNMNYGIYANGLLVETCSKYYLKELSKMTLKE